MNWLPITLICALTLAMADTATKAWLQDYRAREIALVRFTITGLLMVPLLLVQPFDFPPINFWYWMVGLLPLEIGAMLIYMRAIRDHPLSLTLPYLAFTPVFVSLTGHLILGESVSSQGFIGILFVVVGAWLLNIKHAQLRDWRSWGKPLLAIASEPGSRAMLLVAFIYNLSAVMGKGAMQYMDANVFGAFYFVLLGLVTAVIFGFSKPSMLISIWRRPGPVLVVASLMAIMVATHFIALQQIETAYMIAVKRTSLLFGLIFGAFIFHEKGLYSHLLAGGLMVAGVGLILI